MLEQILANLYLYRDTCCVYIIRTGDTAVLVDFGSGGVLDELKNIGVRRVTDVLMTHHHRDQGQGLRRAVEQGIPIWAPHIEQDLFQSVDAHWQARPVMNNYDVRQDRFSLLDPVPLAGTLKDYARHAFGGREWTVVPTPGHTPGSISLLVEVDGRRIAFTGDLIYAPGKVWSMAALQWSYQLMEGAAASILSLRDLSCRVPDMLLPSHGDPITDPQPAMDLLVRRLRGLLDARRENLRMELLLCDPYVNITPHVLYNRTSLSNSYVLLSQTGKALLIDYGYDFNLHNFYGGDRAFHRPWLYTIDALKQTFGVQKIDAVIATHYHDDHVAGFNLLRDVEGAQVWAAENFAPILENPRAYDLPCLWYDPIPVDRMLALGQPVQWEEYTLCPYPLSGHAHLATAIAFEADGKRFLATGDQYKGPEGTAVNYVYQNGFSIDDFRASAELYARLAPDFILSGHWEPLRVEPGYFDSLRSQGAVVTAVHRDLLPLETLDLGMEGFTARIQPYQMTGQEGEPLNFHVIVRNPLSQQAEMMLRLALPDGWQSREGMRRFCLEGGQSRMVEFSVVPPQGLAGRRFRVGVDVTAGEVRLGQQAEALVDLVR